ncbi:hypothetical protein HZA57_04440, partial [Candidatus Poribacteria bacterium]|nr:hypothetical protein [Candidatus Poribacteria bacterium]
ASELAERRPLLRECGQGEEHLARLLDEERRRLIRENERRLERYNAASETWKAAWPEVSRAIEGLPLAVAHERVVRAAAGLLPFRVEECRDE